MTRATPPLAALVVLAIVSLLGPASTALGQVAQEPLVGLSVPRSLLRTDRPGASVTARVDLAAPARLRLRVTDFDGRTVRVLFDGEHPAGSLQRRWQGRDGAGRRVAPGPYRLEVSATPRDGDPGAPEERVEAWLTVAGGPVHPHPGSITVVVDPGHGGTFDGAVAPDGTREADLNLDIGRRLARMLEGAGVNVVLTRDSDSEVNSPAVDRTFDGVIDVTDDLAARNDVANAARADLFIAIHNNFAVDRTTGGPSTYWSDERTFRGRSARLARTIQARMVAALASVAADGWRPYDHGALTYPYYVLRDVDPPRLLRPSRMPGVLSEGLFLSNPRELRMLKRPRVRQAMADAYYQAIAEYLSDRGSQIGYALESAPREAVAGTPVELLLEVRDQGDTPMRGWRLDVRATPAGSLALGQAGPRPIVGSRRVPALTPGARRTVRLTVTPPDEPGEWVLLVDAIDASGARASRVGSPVLEIPLTVLPAPSVSRVPTPAQSTGAPGTPSPPGASAPSS
ncbi:MAG: N-acetylmuramoyl-L-alanine amidase [Candidatus Limnocylindrales bacterium]